MGAVAVVVAGRIELVGVGTDERPVCVEHLPRAEELVVAGERRVGRVVGRVAELAREPRIPGQGRVGPVISEARVLGPDAVIDDADDDSLTGQPRSPRAGRAREIEELGAGIGRPLAHDVLQHERDPGLLLHRGRLGRGEQCREAVQGDGVLVHLLRRADAGALECLVVACPELGALPLGLRGVEVVGADGADQRVRGHDDDVAVAIALRAWGDSARGRHHCQGQGDGRGRSEPPTHEPSSLGSPRSPQGAQTPARHHAGLHLCASIASLAGPAPACHDSPGLRPHRRGDPLGHLRVGEMAAGRPGGRRRR